MSAQQVLASILETGIVAVIRADDGSRLVDVAEALRAGGVTAMEITFTVPGAARILEQVQAKLGDRITLGAGTVLDPATARIAMLSGAKFIVSPHTDREVIELCRQYSVPVMPGALTPTEVVTAWRAGADIVKVFPSDLTGPSYLKALHGPLPQIRLMPTGGVGLSNARDYIRAGAVALGVGGSLVSASRIATSDFDAIQAEAKQLIDVVREARRSLA